MEIENSTSSHPEIDEKTIAVASEKGYPFPSWQVQSKMMVEILIQKKAGSETKFDDVICSSQIPSLRHLRDQSSPKHWLYPMW
jgi:hypothetical protein